MTFQSFLSFRPLILGATLSAIACSEGVSSGDGSGGEPSSAVGGGASSGGSGVGGASPGAGGIDTATGASDAGGATNSGGAPLGAGGSETVGGAEPGVGGGAEASGGSGTGGSEGGLFPTPTSAELLATRPIGWNLGNSLDAPEGETAWGNPEITAGLINAVAGAGFDLVRIPVTYSQRTGAGPAYVIEASHLQRITEVVDWVTNAGMLALINIHHDGADGYGGDVEWLSLNDATGAVTDANNQAVQQRFVALWTQIAAHFQPYGEALLFESMNEIHDGYDAPDPQYYTIINDLNQAFVDVVRGSGGNNVMRHLVVPGYNTNIDYTLEGFEAPTDPTPNHLILSVHFYDPWSFAGEASTNTWGAGQPGADTWGQEDFVVTQFDALSNTFVSAGLPMIIGEYGAVHQTGYEDYRRYYMEYVTRAAVERGIVPVYWDNGSQESGAEAFGLFNRDTNEVLYPSILEAMMRAADGSVALDEIAPPSL